MTESPRRPVRITLVALLMLCGGLWNALRLEQALVFWKTLAGYHLRPGPAYLALSGALWMLAGLALCFGLWTGKRWSRWAAVSVCGLYFVWYWVDRLAAQLPHLNWPFALGVDLLTLALVQLALNTPATEHFLRQKEAYERRSKDQSPA